MYSNEDLERFYFKYQTEALPHGQSLLSFFLNNKVLTYSTSRNRFGRMDVETRKAQTLMF